MIFKIFLIKTAMFVVSVTAFALPDQAADQTTTGFAYTLYSTKPSVEDLGQFPPQYEDPKVEHILQGSEYTLIWNDRTAKRNVDNASFALGERQMGLYIPRWTQGKQASETTGWEEFGYKLAYGDFNVKVEQGEGERELAGGKAQHYVLTADYNSKRKSDPGSSRYQMHTDLWILTDKPFSFAPFHSPGAYGDPRFGAAVVAKLSKLGMVVRSDARYSRISIDADGKEVGTKHEGTWTTWIVDLKPAEVPVLNMPVGDEATLSALQDGFRKQPDETCQAVMAGETPNFIKQNLTSNQQAAVIKDLRHSCKLHVMRAFTQGMKQNPQSVCGDIMAGKVPEVVSQALNEVEQKRFMSLTTSYCEKQPKN